MNPTDFLGKYLVDLPLWKEVENGVFLYAGPPSNLDNAGTIVGRLFIGRKPKDKRTEFFNGKALKSEGFLYTYRNVGKNREPTLYYVVEGYIIPNSILFTTPKWVARAMIPHKNSLYLGLETLHEVVKTSLLEGEPKKPAEPSTKPKIKGKKEATGKKPPKKDPQGK